MPNARRRERRHVFHRVMDSSVYGALNLLREIDPLPVLCLIKSSFTNGDGLLGALDAFVTIHKSNISHCRPCRRWMRSSGLHETVCAPESQPCARLAQFAA